MVKPIWKRDWRERFEETIGYLLENPEAEAAGPMIEWEHIDPDTLPPNLKAAFLKGDRAYKELEMAIAKLEEMSPEFKASRSAGLATAHTQAMIWWMSDGDLRPLASAIANGKVLDPAVGHSLLRMIDKGLWNMKREGRGRGAPKKPGLSLRQLSMSFAYQAAKDASLGSQAAFEKVADDFGVSVETVRVAVTRCRPKAQTNSI
jgi:hypothetical protein